MLRLRRAGDCVHHTEDLETLPRQEIERIGQLKTGRPEFLGDLLGTETDAVRRARGLRFRAVFEDGHTPAGRRQRRTFSR